MRLLILIAAWLCGAGVLMAADDPRGVEFFERKIRPVLVSKCYGSPGAALTIVSTSRPGTSASARGGSVASSS